MDIENSSRTENQMATADVPAVSKQVVAPSAEDKIVKQMTFYFSDDNLPNDDFLLKEVAKDTEGFVPLDIFLRFKRIKELTSDVSVIAKAIEASSSSSLLTLSEDKQKVKRATPLPAHIDDTDRTIYAKGFKLYPEPSIEELTQFFSQYGQVSAVRLRRYVSPRKFKVPLSFLSHEEKNQY